MDTDTVIRIATETKEWEQREIAAIAEENSIRMRMTELQEQLDRILSVKEEAGTKISDLKKELATIFAEKPKKEEPTRRHWSEPDSDEEEDDSMSYYKALRKKEHREEEEDRRSVSTYSRHTMERYGHSVYICHILPTLTEEEIADKAVRRLRQRGIEQREIEDLRVVFTSKSLDDKYRVGFINNLGKSAYDELINLVSLEISGWYIRMYSNRITKPKRFR